MTPGTAAGKATADGIIGGGLSLWNDEPELINELVWKVEQEAAAAERARLRAAVWAMDALQHDDASEPLLRKTTVLALLEPGDG